MRSYGTVQLEDGAWLIEAEPHVRIRIKRLFAKVSKVSHGAVSLSATPENSRELQWLLMRYPMDVTPLEELERLAAESKAIEDAVANILTTGGYEPPTLRMALPARRYQLQAADLAMRTGRLLVADDVGLGKTCTAIATLTDPANLPALVVTLTHLPKQWEAECRKFLPTIRTHIVKKGKPYDLTKGPRGRVDPAPDVIIMNYHKLAGWADHLQGVVRTVIYDECQELRRGESKKYDAAVHVSSGARLRIGLSATPIYNYGGEIFNVLSAIAPAALGTRQEFIREWCTAGPEGRAFGYSRSPGPTRPRISQPRVFGSFLREQGLMLRRTRRDVGRELERLSKVMHVVDANPEALSKVEASAAELAQLILSQTKLDKGVKFRASEQLSNVLRQATGIAKAPYVADFVRLLVESGEPVVLYGWHREVYSVWQAKLKDLKPAMYTGSESATRKAAAREKFLAGKTNVLIMSLRSGAGLDGLQHRCRTVVFGELDWSPGVHDQCAGRVHRDGQEHPVVAYFMVAETGSDPIVADVLGLKRAQMQGIRDPNAALIARTQAVGNHARQLATAYLAQRGIAPPPQRWRAVVRAG